MAPERLRLLRAGALAAFLVFHLVAITLRALPAPAEALDRSAWSDPTVKLELGAWANRLGVAEPQLEDRLYALAQRAVALQNRVVAPFERYYDLCGTYQSWQMFVAPHRHPARLRIDVEEQGRWRTVFREDDGGWLERELGDTRFRSVIFRLAWPSFADQREHFVDFLAARARTDFPRASRLRMVLARADTPSPDQVRRGEKPVEVEDPPLIRVLRTSP